MKNKIKLNYFEVVSLIIGVISLTLGFLAFSTSIIVKPKANMEPNYEVFNVILSSTPDGKNTSAVEGIVLNTGVPGASVDTATIFNDSSSGGANYGSSVIEGLKAYFTEPGQKAEYRIYAVNTGGYSAYLKQVEFKTISGTSTARTCVARAGATQNVVDSICDRINVTVKVKNTLFTNYEGIGKVIEVKNHKLNVGKSEPVIVTISYDFGGREPNGPFDIYFGDIVLTYSSVR